MREGRLVWFPRLKLGSIRMEVSRPFCLVTPWYYDPPYTGRRHDVERILREGKGVNLNKTFQVITGQQKQRPRL